VQRVENHLADAVGVFLPAGNLVVDCEGHALLEAVAVVGRDADDAALDLEAQGNVEVF